MKSLKRLGKKLRRLYHFAIMVKRYDPWDYTYLIAANEIALYHMAETQTVDAFKSEHTDYEVRRMQLLQRVLKTYLSDEDIFRELKALPAEAWDEAYKMVKVEGTEYYTFNEENKTQRNHISNLSTTQDRVKEKRLQWAFKSIGDHLFKWWT